MSPPATLSAQFRHVMFPAEFERRRKVLNFAASGTPQGPAARPDSGLPEEHAAFVAWLFGQAGLDARAYRAETLQRRLPACLRGFRARSVGEARRLLEQRTAVMSPPATLSAQFRHVMFPAEFERRRKVLNFAASGTPQGPAARPDSGLPEEHAAFVAWLFGQAGLDARAYRAETLQRRLPACLRGFRARSVGEARRLLDQSPGRVEEALSAMLVGVTTFFRDPAVFEALERDILPGLMKSRAGLHVWSAGCSDGAELYALGILFAERQWLAGSYLLGTDCRPDAIRRARAGLFEPLTCKNVKPDLLGRYLPPEGGRRRAAPALRNALRWRVADLLQVQEPGVWDLILCRNTTMYLRADAANLLWPKFEALLRPGGVLVLGKAERPVGTKRLTPAGPCMYRRTRG